MAPTLTLFPAPDKHGQRLAQKILQLGREVGYQCRAETEHSLRTGMRAQLCDDVAVYDLTTDGETVGAYRALSAFYVFFDHVLLVSRTPLPLNLLPARPGGAPPYPYPAKRLPDGSPVHFPQFTIAGVPSSAWVAEEDHSLLTWLRQALGDLLIHPTSPRLPREPTFDPLWPYSKELRQFVKGLGLLPSFRNRPQDRVFLSYRGRYFNEALGLSARAAEHGMPDAGRKSIRVVSPLEFAMERELLSAGRRWMVISFLRNLIFTAPEFWIYRTQDYLESWWTLAELVFAGVAVSKGAQGLLDSPRLRVYDPQTNHVNDDIGDLRVRMRKRERTLVEKVSGLAAPGVSSPPVYGPTRDPRPKLPRGVGGRKNWEAFWDTLLIDRRVLAGTARPYAPTVRAFLEGLDEMVPFDERYVAAAAASDGVAWARDGTRLRVAEFVPRLLFTVPSSLYPQRPVLRRLPTYYALP
jgi:hypothetical protein